MLLSTKPELIEKETIGSLSFNQTVLVDQDPSIHNQIELAVRLGNAYHSKVSITFMDDTGLKRVETTIWAHGSKFICLKGGVWIPISRILDVKF